jgi:hypothetical protein
MGDDVAYWTKCCTLSLNVEKQLLSGLSNECIPFMPFGIQAG